MNLGNVSNTRNRMILRKSDTNASLVSLTSSKGGVAGPIQEEPPLLDHIQKLGNFKIKKAGGPSTLSPEKPSSSIPEAAAAEEITSAGSTMSSSDNDSYSDQGHDVSAATDDEEEEAPFIPKVSNLLGSILSVWYKPKNWRYNPEKGFDFLVMSEEQRMDHHCYRGHNVQKEQEAAIATRNLIHALDKTNMALYESGYGSRLEERERNEGEFYSIERRARNHKKLNIFLDEIEKEQRPLNPVLADVMEQKAIRSSAAFKSVAAELQLDYELKITALEKEHNQFKQEQDKKFDDFKIQVLTDTNLRHGNHERETKRVQEEHKAKVERVIGQNKVENLALHHSVAMNYLLPTTLHFRKFWNVSNFQNQRVLSYLAALL